MMDQEDPRGSYAPAMTTAAAPSVGPGPNPSPVASVSPESAAPRRESNGEFDARPVLLKVAVAALVVGVVLHLLRRKG